MAPPRLVFFAHDALDAAVQRRIATFAEQGVSVTGFTMRRGESFDTPWKNVDLGRTYDASFAQRIATLARAVAPLSKHRAELAEADVFYARNLDMLLLARMAKKSIGARAKVVYECLDVHRFLARDNMLGAAMRGLESKLFAGTDLVVVSSPAFCREYFEVRHPGRFRAFLLENRLPRGYDYGQRSNGKERPVERPLRIGWFGNLRCRRSLALLLATAERHRDRVKIVMRGVPARTEIPNIEAQIAPHENVSLAGRYRWPADLPSLYGSVDLVWAGDFHDAGANSKWLLPNRCYEGGYFGVPLVAPADCETGHWITSKGLGFAIDEPLETTLPEFLGTLSTTAVSKARERVLKSPEEWFVQPGDEIKTLLATVLENGEC